MNRQDKISFIGALCRNVQRTMQAAVDRMPPEWDGIELRELAARIFDDSRSDQMRDARGKRRREFDNERIVRNLP